MSNKFLTSADGYSGPDLTDGTADIYVRRAGVGNLETSKFVKTDAWKRLTSSEITVNDISGLNLEDYVEQKEFKDLEEEVGDIFNDYVDKITTLCREKCETELSCSQLLYWELTRYFSSHKQVTISADNMKFLRATMTS